jgi:hypothetical protein
VNVPVTISMTGQGGRGQQESPPVSPGTAKDPNGECWQQHQIMVTACTVLYSACTANRRCCCASPRMTVSKSQPSSNTFHIRTDRLLSFGPAPFVTHDSSITLV